MNNNPKLAAMAVFLAVFAGTTFVETDRYMQRAIAKVQLRRGCVSKVERLA
jgi:hypothetical protein